MDMEKYKDSAACMLVRLRPQSIARRARKSNSIGTGLVREEVQRPDLGPAKTTAVP